MFKGKMMILNVTCLTKLPLLLKGMVQKCILSAKNKTSLAVMYRRLKEQAIKVEHECDPTL